MSTYRALILPLLLLFAFLACDPVIKPAGTVRDRQGTPLAGVTVTLESEGRQPRSVATANDGSFRISMVGADAARSHLTFHKDGFQNKVLQLAESSKPLDVVLQPQ